MYSLSVLGFNGVHRTETVNENAGCQGWIKWENTVCVRKDRYTSNEKNISNRTGKADMIFLSLSSYLHPSASVHLCLCLSTPSPVRDMALDCEQLVARGTVCIHVEQSIAWSLSFAECFKFVFFFPVYFGSVVQPKYVCMCVYMCAE